MCDCVKELEEKIKDHVTKNKIYKKPVKQVRMKDEIYSLTEGLSTKTVSNFEIELEGQKKKQMMPVAHSYCPFCGEKKAA